MKKLLPIWIAVFACCFAFAQAPDTNDDHQFPSAPTMHVTVVSRQVSAVDYRHGKTSKISFVGTDLLPAASGEAKIDSSGAKRGRTHIDAHFSGLQPPMRFAPGYLTYVLWAISPEGRPVSLGELIRDDDGKSTLKATTDLQAFGMVVTAEPYFAVTQPSNAVVMENVVAKGTKGLEQPIIARYNLLPRELYLAAAAEQPEHSEIYGEHRNVSQEVIEARNALRIARAAGAETYATETLERAQHFLDQAEDYNRRRQNRNAVDTVAREAAQTAEEARVIAVHRSEEERVAAQRRAAEDQAEQARQQADQATENETRAREQAEADRAAAERARLQARQAREQARAQQRAAQQEAESARLQAQQAQEQAQQAQLQAQQAEQARAAAEQEHEQTRARLLAQLNQVLQTRDTAEGLIVDMPDVLFDFNRATLKQRARERLAKVAGIIQAYPDLRLKIEGFTDSIGTNEYNQRLSEKRAAAVRDYLIGQGVNVNNVLAEGFGKSNPVASNATPSGRQLNRRVEMLVSGEAIGTQVAPQPGTMGGTSGVVTSPPPATTQPSTPGNTVAAPADRPPK